MKKPTYSNPNLAEIHDPLGFLMTSFFRAESIDSLDSVADIPFGKKLKRYFVGAPGQCDTCLDWPMFHKFMIDGKLKGVGRWAFMCEGCFKSRGVAIGWGFGQLFLHERNEKWLLVGGFPPDGFLDE